jgi:hypothetical protein
MTYIEIFRCCIATGFSDRILLSGKTSADASSQLAGYLRQLDPDLIQKYRASVGRILKGKAEGVMVSYSHPEGMKHHLFIKWYEQHNHIVPVGGGSL